VTFVHVDGRIYGPDSDVPSDVAARITNPDAWDEPPAAKQPPKTEKPATRTRAPKTSGD